MSLSHLLANEVTLNGHQNQINIYHNYQVNPSPGNAQGSIAHNLPDNLVVIDLEKAKEAYERELQKLLQITQNHNRQIELLQGIIADLREDIKSFSPPRKSIRKTLLKKLGMCFF